MWCMTKTQHQFDPSPDTDSRIYIYIYREREREIYTSLSLSPPEPEALPQRATEPLQKGRGTQPQPQLSSITIAQGQIQGRSCTGAAEGCQPSGRSIQSAVQLNINTQQLHNATETQPKRSQNATAPDFQATGPMSN